MGCQSYNEAKGILSAQVYRRWGTVAALAAALLTAAVEATAGMGGTPALGYNNCNIQCCNATMPSASFVKGVADSFIKDVDDLPNVEGIVQICVDMQLRTTSLSEKYKENEKRYYYVTPTSYLVLIQAFKDLLEKKRIEIDSLIENVIYFHIKH